MTSNWYTKLLNDSISGPKNIQTLTLLEQFYLLKIYNKRYIQLIAQYESMFEIYVSDHSDNVQQLIHEFGDEAHIHIVEQGTIYEPTSELLYAHDIVSRDEILMIRKLCHLGFFNFAPNVQVPFTGYQMEGDLILSDFYKRQDLTQIPVFLTIPNNFNLSPDNAIRHFHDKTPQFTRYVDAINQANNDAKSIRAMNNVFATLIVLDEIINTITTKFRSMDFNDAWCIVELNELLDHFDLSKQLEKMDEIDRQKLLQWTDLNMVAGWLFDCNSLHKRERFALLDRLSRGGQSIQAFRDTIQPVPQH